MHTSFGMRTSTCDAAAAGTGSFAMKGAGLLCILALTCCNCQSLLASTATANTSSSVGAQPAPAPAGSIPDLSVESEAEQRRLFPSTDFAFGFDNLDFSTPAGNLSNLVPAIATIASIAYD